MDIERCVDLEKSKSTIGSDFGIGLLISLLLEGNEKIEKKQAMELFR